MNLFKTSMLALALAPTLALASTWEADQAHAGANFTVRHMMISDVRGSLGPVTSTIELDDQDLTRSKIQASIDVTKIDTQNEKRDNHLRSPEFFDVAKHPNITFTGTKIEKVGGDKYKLTGDLTIRGVTKPVTLDVSVSAEKANPWSKVPTRAFIATGTIDRRDFGLVWQQPMANNGLVADWKVKIDLQLEYQKKDTKPVN